MVDEPALGQFGLFALDTRRILQSALLPKRIL
jgi:hypothetical protein